mmetsp:Transcript_6424/g.15529  ORF Transcript_6424/g.15529 Transcript_6424/m.15529 type:complete len:414 (+) Transcript_6424:621-1862(+)
MSQTRYARLLSSSCARWHCFFEQFAQASVPHLRQWCLRSIIAHCLPQRGQPSKASSGIQAFSPFSRTRVSGILADICWRKSIAEPISLNSALPPALPCLFVRDGWAPYFTSIGRTLPVAMCSGVLPVLSLAFGRARIAIRSSIASFRSCRAAECRGVAPVFEFSASTSALCSCRITDRMSWFPAALTACTMDWPSASLSSNTLVLISSEMFRNRWRYSGFGSLSVAASHATLNFPSPIFLLGSALASTRLSTLEVTFFRTASSRGRTPLRSGMSTFGFAAWQRISKIAWRLWSMARWNGVLPSVSLWLGFALCSSSRSTMSTVGLLDGWTARCRGATPSKFLSFTLAFDSSMLFASLSLPWWTHQYRSPWCSSVPAPYAIMFDMLFFMYDLAVALIKVSHISRVSSSGKPRTT